LLLLLLLLLLLHTDNNSELQQRIHTQRTAHTCCVHFT
jgi:hypothetical protein